MRLGRIEELQALFSEGSRPTKATVRDWIEDPTVTQVVGRKVGRCWYVDLDHFDSSTGNDLADRILSARG